MKPTNMKEQIKITVAAQMTKELSNEGFTLRGITALWLTKGSSVTAFYDSFGTLLRGDVTTVWRTSRSIQDAPAIWALCVELGKHS